MTVRVMEEWQGKSLDDILWLCQETVEDSEVMTVKRWREAGGKVLGHFQVYFPEEIAHAAGMLPMTKTYAAVSPSSAFCVKSWNQSLNKAAPSRVPRPTIFFDFTSFIFTLNQKLSFQQTFPVAFPNDQNWSYFLRIHLQNRVYYLYQTAVCMLPALPGPVHTF